jgi:hypothetical protein
MSETVLLECTKCENILSVPKSKIKIKTGTSRQTVRVDYGVREKIEVRCNQCGKVYTWPDELPLYVEDTTPYCPKCGRPAENHWTYCGYCGNSMKTNLNQYARKRARAYCPKCNEKRDPNAGTSYKTRELLTHCTGCGAKLKFLEK